MGTQLRSLIIITCVIALTVIINMIRREKLELKYCLIWIVTGLAILFMGCIPRSIDVMASILGVMTPINALFFVGLCFSLLIIFSLTIAQSRNSKRIKELAQKLALLEYEIEKYKAERENNIRVKEKEDEKY